MAKLPDFNFLARLDFSTTGIAVAATGRCPVQSGPGDVPRRFHQSAAINRCWVLPDRVAGKREPSKTIQNSNLPGLQSGRPPSRAWTCPIAGCRVNRNCDGDGYSVNIPPKVLFGRCCTANKIRRRG